MRVRARSRYGKRAIWRARSRKSLHGNNESWNILMSIAWQGKITNREQTESSLQILYGEKVYSSQTFFFIGFFLQLFYRRTVQNKYEARPI